MERDILVFLFIKLKSERVLGVIVRQVHNSHERLRLKTENLTVQNMAKLIFLILSLMLYH